MKTLKLCSSSCGDIKNISYPFHLKEDSVGFGDPNYELSCENKKTIINFHERKYSVKRFASVRFDFMLYQVVINNIN